MAVLGALGELVVALSADTARFQSDLGAANRAAKKFQSELTRSFDGVKRSLIGLAGGLSLGKVLEEATRAVMEAEQSEARLAATLKATGNASGFAAAGLEVMNAQLKAATRFDDESIRNAQAQLVKFGNISGDVFQRALSLSADYAELLGTDLPSAVQQIGRALSAPAIGLTFLERNVGKFSAETHRAITEMTDLGNTAGAQQLVLGELEKRLGGVAETMNTGVSKATADVSKNWHDLLEAWGRTPAVGGLVEKTLNAVATALKGFTPGNKVSDELAQINAQIEGLTRGLKPGDVEPIPVKGLKERREALLELQRLESHQTDALAAQSRSAADAAKAEQNLNDARAKRLTSDQILLKQMEGQDELLRQQAEFTKYASDEDGKAAADKLKMLQQVTDGEVSAAQQQKDLDDAALEESAAVTAAQAKRFEDFQAYLGMQKELEDQDFKDRLDALATFNEEQIGQLGGAQSAIESLTAAHNYNLFRIEDQKESLIRNARMATFQEGVELLQAWGTKNKAAAIAALAISKGLAIAQVIHQTAVASMAALAPPPIGLGPVAGAALAASIKALGAVQIGLIAATGLVQAANVGGGGATVGSAANPAVVTPSESAASAPAAAPAPVQTTIIHFEAKDDVALSAKSVRKLLDQIAEQTRSGGRVVIA